MWYIVEDAREPPCCSVGPRVVGDRGAEADKLWLVWRLKRVVV